MEWAHRILFSDTPGAWIFGEVEPVVTLGKQGFKDPASARIKYPFPVVSLDRGGHETFHGPGMPVLFWVERLDKYPKASSGKLADLLEVLALPLLEVLRLQDPSIQFRSEEPVGFWNKNQGKIGSMGIRIWNRVALHGICVNLWRSPEFQKLEAAEGPRGERFSPCGQAGSKLEFVWGSTNPGREALLKFAQILHAKYRDLYPDQFDKLEVLRDTKQPQFQPNPLIGS